MQANRKRGISIPAFLFVYQREGDFEAALECIAGALARDKTGEYRERLLQKQQEVLAGLTQKNQQEYLLMVNLVSKTDGRREEKEK